MTMLDLSRKHDRATELRAIADGRLLLNVRNGVTVSRSMLAKIADELEAERAAHAETKRELLEMEKSQMRQASACGMATSRAEAATALAANDAELDGAVFLKDAAEAALRKREVEINKLHAQLAEARKAQRYLNDGVFVGLPDQEIARRARLLVDAARRVREGGKIDG